MRMVHINFELVGDGDRGISRILRGMGRWEKTELTNYLTPRFLLVKFSFCPYRKSINFEFVKSIDGFEISSIPASKIPRGTSKTDMPEH